MNYLYALYDALVSISVPSDKARAVVDAMERDMDTSLATKQDLLSLATREDLLATKQDLRLLATKEELLLLKQDVAVLREEMESRFNLLAHGSHAVTLTPSLWRRRVGPYPIIVERGHDDRFTVGRHRNRAAFRKHVAVSERRRIWRADVFRSRFIAALVEP